jgi:hypothetical protein
VAGAKKKTKKKTASKAKPKPKAKPKKRVARKPAARSAFRLGEGQRALGEITVPSGKLAIFDIGLAGYLPREALEPTIVTCDVPTDRALPVVGTKVGGGRFADCWKHVAITLGDGEVARSKKLGDAAVDFARLVCMDHGALDAWQHDESLDGKADVVFWGRDGSALAHAMAARRVDEGFGWVGLPLAEAEAKHSTALRKKSENKWLLATDFRPHSHHYYALAAARQSRDGAGMFELANTRMLLFFTSWGDGVYPIYLDVDAADRPIQVRIQLAS